MGIYKKLLAVLLVLNLVLALDFMFWFGYGWVDRGGKEWLRKESKSKVRILPAGITLEQLAAFADAEPHLERPLDAKHAD